MKFIAIVEDSQKANIHEIAKKLQNMGINVEQVLKMTGIITGNSNSHSLQTIKIDGIKSVEADRKISAYR